MAFLCGIVGGTIASVVRQWTLERKVTQFELALYDLTERLTIEMKKRASQAARSKQEFDQSVFDAAKTAPVTPSPQFWWLPYANRKADNPVSNTP